MNLLEEKRALTKLIVELIHERKAIASGSYNEITDNLFDIIY